MTWVWSFQKLGTILAECWPISGMVSVRPGVNTRDVSQDSRVPKGKSRPPSTRSGAHTGARSPPGKTPDPGRVIRRGLRYGSVRDTSSHAVFQVGNFSFALDLEAAGGYLLRHLGLAAGNPPSHSGSPCSVTARFSSLLRNRFEATLYVANEIRRIVELILSCRPERSERSGGTCCFSQFDLRRIVSTPSTGVCGGPVQQAYGDCVAMLLSPLGDDRVPTLLYPRLAPWALFSRRFAACGSATRLVPPGRITRSPPPGSLAYRSE